MKKKFTKKERLAIYKKLLNEVSTQIHSSWGSGCYLCWKLYVEIFGFDEFQKLNSFNKECYSSIKKEFPEFAKHIKYGGLSMDGRINALNECIDFCQPKIKLNQLEAWLGSDQDNESNLKKMLLDITNGKYSAEGLRHDILSYE